MSDRTKLTEKTLNDNNRPRPVIALAMGDPAGISPELTAKIAALPEARAAARMIVVGDRRVFDEGAKVAGVAADVDVVGANDALPADSGRPASC